MKNRKNTKKRRNSKNKTKKAQKAQKGGVESVDQEMNEKTAFDTFIANSNITILPVRTGSGFLFVSTLKTDAPSVYKNIRKSLFSEKVDKIIVKLVAVSPDHHGRKKTWTSSIGEKDIEKRSGFMNECNIQREVFERTKEPNNDPICPAILYSSVMENSYEATELLQKMAAAVSHENTHTSNILNEIQHAITNQTIPLLGVLVMEMADGYKSLTEMYSQTDVVPYDTLVRLENMARLRILQMAAYTGYSIQDFNTGNILCNPNATGYYKNIPGHVIIIDFGNAEKLADDKLSAIRGFMDSGNYVAALTVFKDLVRQDGARLDYFAIHGWLYYRFDKKTGKRGVGKRLGEPSTAQIAKYDAEIKALIDAENADEPSLKKMRT
jgi:hypothetical protein